MAEYHPSNGKTDLKADFTYGLNIRPKLKLVMQLQTGAPQDDPAFMRFAPSAVIKITGNSHLELGLTAGIVGDEQVGLKIGFWRDF